MTFTRANPAGWALYEVLTSTQMNAVDVNVSRALDGNAGGNYTPSSDLKVHGKIIGDDVASRTFLYPLSAGTVLYTGGGGNTPWVFDLGSGGTDVYSDAVAQAVVYFALNRFVPNGCSIIKIRAYVDPGTTQSGNARMNMYFYRTDENGASDTIFDLTYYTDETGNAAAWIDMISGYHDGGDGQAALTDSLKSWPVNSLVGRTISNDTDGSSGTISANTGTGVTATLSGGTDNDWDDDDVYSIPLDEELDTESYQYFVAIVGTNNASSDSIKALEITYTEGDYLRTP